MRTVRLAPASEETPVGQWTLTRESGGWALRLTGEGGSPAYFTTTVVPSDQNAAFEWARDVTTDVDRKGIRYVGTPPA